LKRKGDSGDPCSIPTWISVKYCSRIYVYEYSVYTNVNMNVHISGIALNQRSVQQASGDIRASSAYEQEKALLFF